MDLKKEIDLIVTELEFQARTSQNNGDYFIDLVINKYNVKILDCISKYLKFIGGERIESDTFQSRQEKSDFSKRIKYGRFLIETINSMETVAVCDLNCEKAEQIQKIALEKLENLLKAIK